MLSGIQTFGESLSEWMEEKGLTPSSLAAFTRGTRDATIARLMHDQLDYKRCARYITELSETYPDIDEETLKRLRMSVDVNRYGKERFLAKQNFQRMITDDIVHGRPEGTNADVLCEKLFSWSESMSFKLLCMGLTDREPIHFLKLVCEKKKDIHILHFFDREYVGSVSGLLAETLPLAFNPEYELYEIGSQRRAMMNNVLIARREDGAHLLIVYDGDKFSTINVSKDTELFGFCISVLFSRASAPKKINCHFSYNSPKAFEDFLTHCLSLEKDKAIYQIKNEIGLEYVPVKILVENFSAWAQETDERFLPHIGDLKGVFDQRYENLQKKTEPTYLIMTKRGMIDFAETGMMKDHPFCLFPFTPDQRREILRNLLKAAEDCASFTPLVFSADDITLNYSFIGYSRECMLVCTANANYDLSDYTEIILDSAELAGQFADYVTGILAKYHVMSKKAGLDFIASLLKIIPDEN
ncbi:MAG: hypothetical protein IIW08_04375 [Clostridia bacterium]|nr:hypothetical protein [Clostridia bacterium]